MASNQYYNYYYYATIVYRLDLYVQAFSLLCNPPLEIDNNYFFAIRARKIVLI